MGGYLYRLDFIWHIAFHFSDAGLPIRTGSSCSYGSLSCEFESRSGMVYLIHQYVIKFVSDPKQLSGFLWVLRFQPPITPP